MSDIPKTKTRLNKKQKEEMKDAIEQALFEANVVDVSADKDYILVVRVGNDAHPANVEQLRVVNNYLSKLKDDGFLPKDMLVVTVAHTVEFTREALADIEWLDGGADVID